MKNINKLVIGVTGKIGSGKSTVAGIFKDRYDFERIDADSIGHLAQETAKNMLVKEFGKVILDPEGKIDRVKLGNIVFFDEEKLTDLNSIVHPIMKNEIAGYINNKAGDKNFIIDAALLFQMELNILCDFTIYIDSKENQAIQRTINSKKWTEEKARNVIKIQEKFDELKSKCDFILVNDGQIDELNLQIDAIMKSIIN